MKIVVTTWVWWRPQKNISCLSSCFPSFNGQKNAVYHQPIVKDKPEGMYPLILSTPDEFSDILMTRVPIHPSRTAEHISSQNLPSFRVRFGTTYFIWDPMRSSFVHLKIASIFSSPPVAWWWLWDLRRNFTYKQNVKTQLSWGFQSVGFVNFEGQIWSWVSKEERSEHPWTSVSFLKKDCQIFWSINYPTWKLGSSFCEAWTAAVGHRKPTNPFASQRIQLLTMQVLVRV